MQSQTITAVIIQLLVVFLPMFGVIVGNEQITATVQTLAVIGASLWIWIRRYQQGDIKIFGGRKLTRNS